MSPIVIRGLKVHSEMVPGSEGALLPPSRKNKNQKKEKEKEKTKKAVASCSGEDAAAAAVKKGGGLSSAGLEAQSEAIMRW